MASGQCRGRVDELDVGQACLVGGGADAVSSLWPPSGWDDDDGGAHRFVGGLTGLFADAAEQGGDDVGRVGAGGWSGPGLEQAQW